MHLTVPFNLAAGARELGILSIRITLSQYARSATYAGLLTQSY
jgi:hypothetical protein